MIETSELNISGYGFLQAFILGILLFFVLKALRKGVSLLLLSTGYRRLILRIFPAAGALVWIAFAYWAVHSIIQSRYYATLAWLAVLTISSAWIAWFALRDYFAGLILRIHDDYEENQHFRLGDIEGTIRKLSLLNIELEQENGERVKIPYGRISGEIHWKNREREGPNYHKFFIHMAKSASIDLILDKLRLCILNSPWAASNKEPQIRLIGQSEKGVDCEVCAYALNTDYGHILEMDVKKQMSD